jgi:hypothetical protein
MADEPNPSNGVASQANPWDMRQAKRMVKIERLKDALGAITRERDEYKLAAQSAAKERDELAVKADNSAMVRRVKELEGLLRGARHEAVFGRLAKASGADPDAVSYLYQLSGWQADGDEPDEEAMAAAVDELKVRPGLTRLFGIPEPKAEEAPQKVVKKAVGTGQGKGDRQSIVDFTPEQLRDPSFVLNHYDQVVAQAQGKIDRGEI